MFIIGDVLSSLFAMLFMCKVDAFLLNISQVPFLLVPGISAIYLGIISMHKGMLKGNKYRDR
jgi:hypothetical protein